MLVDSVFEMCPYCDTEVELKEVQYQFETECPNCSEKILPCSLCDNDVVKCKDCGSIYALC